MPKHLEYAESIDNLLAGPTADFSPFAEYDADGDCIEFFVKPDPYHADRYDELLTVYRSQETNEIVGSLIKGVSLFWKEIVGKHPNFRIEVHDGKIRLVHIFRAKLWSLPTEKHDLVKIYQILTEEAERTNAEVEASPCAVPA